MRVLFVRHGESTGNELIHHTFGHGRRPSDAQLEALAAGPYLPDDELTPKGLRQAQLLAEYYAGPLRAIAAAGGVVKVVASVQSRAMQVRRRMRPLAAPSTAIAPELNVHHFARLRVWCWADSAAPRRLSHPRRQRWRFLQQLSRVAAVCRPGHA